MSAPAPRRAVEDDSTAPQDQRDLPVLGESATLSDYFQYAALSNAGLESAFQVWRASVERLPQERSLPDPRITYGYFIHEVQTRVGKQEQQVGLSQTFPWFGTLRDKEDAARRAANAAYARLEVARLDLFYRVESAYNELFFLDRSIDITTQNLDLLTEFERIARARYRVAAAGHPDITRVQVELGKLEDRIRQLRDMRAPLAARLNAALNRPLDAEVALPTSVRDRTTDDSSSELLATLRSHNPRLLALTEEAQREQIRADIASKDALPDFTIGVTYTDVEKRRDMSVPDNGDDALLATLSFNLPIWRGRYDAGVREARARRRAIVSSRADTEYQLGAQLQQALFDHHDARRRIELFRDTLIPKANESIAASLTAFELGTVDFLDLIDTERSLLEFQLGLERAIVDRATSYARLEMLVGAPLGALPEAPAAEEDRR